MIQIYALAALLAILGAGGWYAHHHVYSQGYDAGVKEQTKETDKIKTAMDEANSQLVTCAGALDNVNVALATAKQDEARQAQAADHAIASARSDAADADATLKTWIRKYAGDIQTTACKTIAEQKLCAALQSY